MMVYFKDREWHIAKKQIAYTDDGQEFTNYIGQEGEDWWLELEKIHDNITIVDFTEIDITAEQLERIEEVNLISVGDGHHTVVEEYVFNNKFPTPANHPLKDLELTKLRQMVDIMLGVAE